MTDTISDNTTGGTKIVEVARALATILTPGWDRISADKREWTFLRGKHPDETVNGPFKCDLMDAAEVAIAAMRTPTDAQRNAYFAMRHEVFDDSAWEAMIDCALAETAPKDAPA
mgnify:CR=1 FL=1